METWKASIILSFLILISIIYTSSTTQVQPESDVTIWATASIRPAGEDNFYGKMDTYHFTCVWNGTHFIWNGTSSQFEGHVDYYFNFTINWEEEQLNLPNFNQKESEK